MEHDVDWYKPADGNYTSPLGWHGLKKTSDLIQNHTRYTAQFRDYYLFSPEFLSQTLLPRLPSGLTAPSYQLGLNEDVRVNGDPAPDELIDFKQAKSGNIFIFARRININSKLTNATQVPYDNLNCTSAPTYRLPVITAMGASGGGEEPEV